MTYCASIKAAIPNEPSRITVTLPGRIGNVAAASLRDLKAPGLPKKLLPLEARPVAPGEPGAAEEDVREFTFPNSASSLTRETLDRFIVQLWDDAGEWVTDVPFALLPDERQDHPLSGW